MPEGEFTHGGDLCSFEVLCKRFALSAPGLVRIGEIIHNLDVKDGRYGRPETAGVRVLIQGLVAQHASDVAPSMLPRRCLMRCLRRINLLTGRKKR